MNIEKWKLCHWLKPVILFVLFCGISAPAKIIAFWDFEEAEDGQYGLQNIEESIDSVSGLVAVPASGGPVYVRGADGKGHGTGSGILKVAGDDSLLAGFSEFNISFDARLHAAPKATQALLRYGVSKTAWNIYTTTDQSIRIELFDESGARYSVRSDSFVFPAGDGAYHHFEFIWDGKVVSILVDGELKAELPVEADTLQATGGAGCLGIGGIVREVGTTGQEFNGFIDNIIINNKAEVR